MFDQGRGMGAYGNADQVKDKYKMYQKEAQVITVSGFDSTVYFSIPELKANFINIGMNESQEMSYQIKSFRFNNTFSNIKATDVIRVGIDIHWEKGDPYTGLNEQYVRQSEIAVTEATLRIELGETGSENGPVSDRCMQAGEIIQAINSQILDTAMTTIREIADNTSELVPPQFVTWDIFLECIYFMQGFQLSLSQQEGKLGLVADISTPIYPIMPYVAIAPPIFPDNEISPPEWHVKGATIKLWTDEKASEKDQTRIATYFNMVKFDTQHVPLTFNNQPLTSQPLYYCSLTGNNVQLNGDGMGGIDLMEGLQASAGGNGRTFLVGGGTSTEFWANEMYLLNNASFNEANVAIPEVPGVAGDMNEINFNETAGGRNIMIASGAVWEDYPMEVVRYTDIYIRTSLNTNHWEYTGKKSDIMEIIPVVQGTNEIGQELRTITRIYESKDPSINTFTVRFTDEKGELIEFNSPYTLTLAVFFTAM